MPRERAGSALPLVRRSWLDGRWRRFVHPGSGARLDPSGRAVQGQLVGRATTPADLAAPLHLPLLRAGCDASGACCALYHHIPASTEDRDRILTVLSDWEGPGRPEDLFVQAFAGAGGALGEVLNIAKVQGRCALQRSDGLCRVQLAAGADAKPAPCQAYPAVLIACGDEWHASLRPECACLARHAIEGALLPDAPEPWVQLRAVLPRIWAVPDEVVIDADSSLPRDEYVAWMRRGVGALKTSFDPLQTLAELAVTLDVDLAEADDDWLRSLLPTLDREVAEADLELHRDSPLRALLTWGRDAVLGLLEGAPQARFSRGRESDHGRRAASLAAFVLHGHLLLEWPELGPALGDLRRFLWLARHGEAIAPIAERDVRLEPITAALFLQRHVEWSRAE